MGDEFFWQPHLESRLSRQKMLTFSVHIGPEKVVVLVFISMYSDRQKEEEGTFFVHVLTSFSILGRSLIPTRIRSIGLLASFINHA